MDNRKTNFKCELFEMLNLKTQGSSFYITLKKKPLELSIEYLNKLLTRSNHNNLLIIFFAFVMDMFVSEDSSQFHC